MSHGPPGTLRAALLLARLAVRRWSNRLALLRARRGKPGERRGTARKSGRPGILVTLVAVIFFLQSISITAQFVNRLGNRIEEFHAPPPAGAAEDGDPGGETSIEVGDAPEESGETVFEIGGDAGHVVGEHDPDFEEVRLWIDRDAWPGAGSETAMLDALSVTLLLLMLAGFFNSMGGASQELAQVGWSMEWLFSFPVPARGLFLARLGEYALTNAFGWFTLLPMSLVMFWNSGHGWWSLPMSLLCALCLNIVVAAGRVLVETWLRKRLSIDRLKNARALATLLGLVFMFGAFYLAFSRELPTPLLAALDRMPAAMRASPQGAVTMMVREPWAAAGVVGWALLFSWLAVRGTSALVRDGLVTSGGARRGVRGVDHAVSLAAPSVLRGSLGKEVRLLLRDRNFLVQTLVTPLVLIGLQMIINPHLFRGGGTGGAIVAFAIGGYVLMFGAFSVLAVERDALWLLFTFPVPLARILRRKVVLWACIAATYCGVALAIFWRPGPAPDANTLVSPFVALIGIFLFAFYAAGLGCLGTDPLEQVAQKRVRPAWMYLYMTLAGLYGFGIYSGVLWSKLVLIVLMALLTSAIWQKVYERLPLLLDPTQLPPPRLSLSDGLIAALLFFVFQAAISLPLHSVAKLPPGAVAAIAYPVAGVLTAGIMLIAFLRMKIPRLGTALGLGAGPSPGRGLALGVVAGAGCALFAFGYLLLVGQVEPLREWRDQAMQRTLGENPLAYWPLLLLYVAAAPIFEEFIFRGLIFQGLARTMPVARAVVANGVIFAIVHPPIAFPAVFLLGVVAALVFRRTRSLWPAILTHAVYNGLVVLVGSRF